MADTNDQTFTLLRSQTFELVKSAAADQTVGYANRIKTFLVQYNNMFYAVLRGLGINSSKEPPQLSGARFYSPWRPLNPEYEARKPEASSGFYHRTGGLDDILKARKAKDDFGEALVAISQQGRGYDKDQFTTDSRGRLRYKSGVRGLADGRMTNLGGRFVSSTLFREIQFTVTFRLFQDVASDFGNINELVGQAFSPGSPGYYKMAVNEFGRTSGKAAYPGRPLLRPMLYWYATTNLRAEMKQKFKVTI